MRFLSAYSQEINSPANYGLSSSGLRYPGFERKQCFDICPRQFLWLPMQESDIISCKATSPLYLAAFYYSKQNDETHGKNAISAIIDNSLPTATDNLDFNTSQISERLAAIDIEFADLTIYQIDKITPEAAIWKATNSIILILIFPTPPNSVVTTSIQGNISVEYIPSKANNLSLPSPLGQVLEEFTIPRGTAKSYFIPKNCYVQIIDAEGRQCSDFMAFNALALDNNQEKHIDSTVSRTFTAGSYPRPGLFI